MITLSLLIIITGMLLITALCLLAIGGTIFGIIAADIIVAVFIIWFLFFRKKKNKE